MHQLIKDLIMEGPVVTDGAWGTELQNRGLKIGESPESWNLSHPELVEEVPRLYVEAGSRVVLTNTFGANHFVQKKFKLEDKVSDYNKAGVEISKKAAGEKALVFASIGPSGKLLITGEVSESELEKAFGEQASAISNAGADAIVVETMIDVNEAIIAVNAAKKTGLPVVACMVFDSGKNKDRTMMGNSPEEVVEKFIQAGADVIGSNCGQGIDGFIKICEAMRDITDLPLWMKANAGLPEIQDGKTVYNTTPGEFVKFVPDLVNAGAAFIGGCCGTNPDFIRAIRKTVDEL